MCGVGEGALSGYVVVGEVGAWYCHLCKLMVSTLGLGYKEMEGNKVGGRNMGVLLRVFMRNIIEWLCSGWSGWRLVWPSEWDRLVGDK